MYRRIVTLLLLPCVLLTQSVAHGHSHGEGQDAGNDARPHFHAALAVSPPDHDHHHQGPGSHHHQSDRNADPTDAPIAPHSDPSESLPDHNSDAVFVAASDAVGGRSEFSEGIHSAFWWTAACTDSIECVLDDRLVNSKFCGHPPPLVGRICPLYVRHLALLI